MPFDTPDFDIIYFMTIFIFRYAIDAATLTILFFFFFHCHDFAIIIIRLFAIFQRVIR